MALCNRRIEQELRLLFEGDAVDIRHEAGITLQNDVKDYDINNPFEAFRCWTIHFAKEKLNQKSKLVEILNEKQHDGIRVKLEFTEMYPYESPTVTMLSPRLVGTCTDTDGFKIEFHGLSVAVGMNVALLTLKTQILDADQAWIFQDDGDKSTIIDPVALQEELDRAKDIDIDPSFADGGLTPSDVLGYDDSNDWQTVQEETLFHQNECQADDLSDDTLSPELYHQRLIEANLSDDENEDTEITHDNPVIKELQNHMYAFSPTLPWYESSESNDQSDDDITMVARYDNILDNGVLSHDMIDDMNNENQPIRIMDRSVYRTSLDHHLRTYNRVQNAMETNYDNNEEPDIHMGDVEMNVEDDTEFIEVETVHNLVDIPTAAEETLASDVTLPTPMVWDGKFQDDMVSPEPTPLTNMSTSSNTQTLNAFAERPEQALDVV